MTNRQGRISTMAEAFKGKTVLITGGSRGLGAATAVAFARGGADVAITYVESHDKAEAVAGEARSLGVQAHAYRSDQVDVAQAKPLIDGVVRDFGRLDILVNNAGVVAYGSVDDPATGFGALDRLIAVLFTGMIAMTRAAAPVLSEDGRIISIGSPLGLRAGVSGVAETAAVRAALDGYTKGIARDLAPRNITVNAVHAGLMDTDMNADNEALSHVLATLCFPRFARLEEIIAPILFLASPAASYITGSVISANGGYLA
jgi:3-oxoacyl-[acyl-carrier protein] reductase